MTFDMEQERSADRAEVTGDSYPPGESVFSEDGVDLTVIRWMLSMTPLQRLETLQNHVRSVMRLRGEEPGD